MVTSGTLQPTCSLGSPCEIPTSQDLNGSIAYDLTGSSHMVKSYFELTQRMSTMNAARFNFTCSASESKNSTDIVSPVIVNQLQDYGLGATFYATSVQTDSPGCDRNAVFFYSFRLNILNDYETWVGDDSDLFLSSTEAQLNKLLNIPSECLLSTFINRTDVSGSFNG